MRLQKGPTKTQVSKSKRNKPTKRKSPINKSDSESEPEDSDINENKFINVNTVAQKSIHNTRRKSHQNSITHEVNS